MSKITESKVWSIAKREFFSFFNSSTAYILIAPFLLITFILYLRTSFIFNQASLRSYFEILPYFLIFFAPAIAMKTFAQEQKNKTLEIFFAHPISELEIVLGKFFGALGFFAVFLLTTITLPITSLVFSSADIGVIIAQYLGALLVGGSFLAIGIAFSAIGSSQVGSFLLSAVVSFALIILGFDFVLLSTPASVSAVLAQVAILPHAQNISRGFLDFRDILYFLTIIAVFLMIAIIRLSQRRIVENKEEKKRLNLALGIILALGFILNLVMYSYPIRLDITKNKLFTLSKGTKETLEKLPDVVTVNLYTTSNIPGALASNVQVVRDMLSDYESIAKGKIIFAEKHPDQNVSDQTAASEDGVQEIQFNQYGSNSFAIASGYFGLSIYYGEEKEVIPFFQTTDDLEYQLTSKIRKLTVINKPVLSIYSPSNMNYGSSKSIAYFRELLSDQYEVTDVGLDNDANIEGNTLLVYGLSESLSATASGKIENYVNSGKSAVLLLDNNQIDESATSANSYLTGLESLLSNFGITNNQDMVFDLAQNEAIRIGNQGFVYFIQYPFWLRATPADKDFPSYGGAQYVNLAWANSLGTKEIEGVKLMKILETSNKAGVQTGTYTISPQAASQQSSYDLENLSQKTVAVAAERGSSKLVVVTDSEFITDDFAQGNANNAEFGLGILQWASSDNVMASIRRKSGENPVYTFNSQIQATIVQYANLILPPTGVIVFGVWFLLRRKRLYQRKFN